MGFLATGEKVRISKKSGSIIQKPENPMYSRDFRNKDKIDGPRDTSTQKVLEVTYKGENFD